jgi:ribulose 1,5-bisphosphate carboxylase large subunit-like protein
MTLYHTADDSVLATYYIESKQRLADVARTVAEIETTGKWLGQGPASVLFHQCKGEVADVKETSPGVGTVSILFPLRNLDLEHAAFSSLWLLMVGGGTFALVDYEKSRLVDFVLPGWAYRHFPGPKFGVAGTRHLLSMKDSELIIGTIVKPTSGLTPEQVARMCMDAAMAGVRFIKDDEKMMNAAYCPLATRVKLVVEGLKRAEDTTGQKVIYAPHITAGPERIREYAQVALDNGASGLMLNFFAAGFGSLEMLARDTQIDVPLYAHCGGKEAMGRAAGQGIAPNVVAKFARLVGGDYFRSGILDSYLVGSPEESALINRTLREPLPGIRDAVPALSGGLGPRNLAANLAAFGTDIMVLAGTGIFSHPLGARGGVEAMKQAAQAFMLGITPADYARDHPELAAVL